MTDPRDIFVEEWARHEDLIDQLNRRVQIFSRASRLSQLPEEFRAWSVADCDERISDHYAFKIALLSRLYQTTGPLLRFLNPEHPDQHMLARQWESITEDKVRDSCEHYARMNGGLVPVCSLETMQEEVTQETVIPLLLAQIQMNHDFCSSCLSLLTARTIRGLRQGGLSDDDKRDLAETNGEMKAQLQSATQQLDVVDLHLAKAFWNRFVL